MSGAKGHTIDLAIIALSEVEEQGLVPCSEFMDLKKSYLSDLRTDPLAVGSRFMNLETLFIGHWHSWVIKGGLVPP